VPPLQTQRDGWVGCRACQAFRLSRSRSMSRVLRKRISPRMT
jgi:hypothetical protein